MSWQFWRRSCKTGKRTTRSRGSSTQMTSASTGSLSSRRRFSFTNGTQLRRALTEMWSLLRSAGVSRRQSSRALLWIIYKVFQAKFRLRMSQRNIAFLDDGALGSTLLLLWVSEIRETSISTDLLISTASSRCPLLVRLYDLPSNSLRHERASGSASVPHYSMTRSVAGSCAAITSSSSGDRTRVRRCSPLTRRAHC